ncbi:dihydrodipicolinate synthase family protein [Psychromicrobium lacuslunae]|uniref:Dihydrodipicolinate synthase family protein n=1 Tax=Psychromicrobium lacuslunae TaxID=1618207 RepID=A0A0D4C110_9MICC|nr:dihydrodipicolinate synthase family protein [Psychromicrobium lacuslunae]AJT42244.1 hypothetical protein UM93_13420 [Psychromicrobium lacuslunae]
MSNLGQLDAAPRTAPVFNSRRAYAAAHVVPQAEAENTPGGAVKLDWDATLRIRHRLWQLGLGVAEAMDTAQRGMGLDWPSSAELIRRSAQEAQAVNGLLACGAGTDQLDPASIGDGGAKALKRILAAYRQQIDVVQNAGGTVILMASRALAKAARHADDYFTVYSTLLDELDRPAILHWLGDMFDPALRGYWGSTDLQSAEQTVLQIISAHPEKVDGIKMSLLDPGREISLRRRLPLGVRMYTGDDYNYSSLIHGDEYGHSDALLGAFAAIAPVASEALAAYDRGEPEQGRALLATTEELSRHIFAEPTYYYKTGIAFLSWLNGDQPGFQMVAGLHAARSVPHLRELHRLASLAGVLKDPGLARSRMDDWLRVCGVQR